MTQQANEKTVTVRLRTACTVDSQPRREGDIVDVPASVAQYFGDPVGAKKPDPSGDEKPTEKKTAK